MTVTVKRAMYSDILYCVAHMRDSDRKEISALMFGSGPDEETAKAAHQLSSDSWVGLLDGVPAAVMGLIEMWPGSWQVWMFGTDDFMSVGAKFCAMAGAFGKESLRGYGARRLECKSAADHHEAHVFIQKMGGRIEATHKNYGKDGEDFVVFAWFPPFVT